MGEAGRHVAVGAGRLDHCRQFRIEGFAAGRACVHRSLLFGVGDGIVARTWSMPRRCGLMLAQSSGAGHFMNM
jgi:hypothetical protein